MKLRFPAPLLASLLLLAGQGGARAQELHRVDPGTTVREALSPAVMNQRIEAAAERYKQYAPVPRIALFDMAYPRDAMEYAATGGAGVVLVVIYTQQKAELPLQRLYVRTANQMTELELMASAISEAAPGSAPGSVFGRHRWEGLYAFPTALQKEGAEIMADYQINRSNFVVTKFPGPSPVERFSMPNAAPVPYPVAREALKSLVRREYPGFAILFSAPVPPASAPQGSQATSSVN